MRLAPLSVRILRVIVLFATFVAISANGQGNKRIPAALAAQHIGETATVCGNVASSRYLSASRSKPTFLNIGKAYPDQDFTVLIWPEDRPKFGHPEEKYLHKNICVTGDITSYRGKPEIVARNPGQVQEE